MMAQMIPVNVNNQMLSSDASSMALDLNGPSLALQHENSVRTLSPDEAMVVIGRLSEENRQLRENVQQANLAMQNAFDMITKLKETDERRQKEINQRCTQAKEKIETLRQAVADKDKTIEEHRKQSMQMSGGPSDTGNQYAKSLAQANQSTLQHKQKADQLTQLLAIEKAQKAQLFSQLDTANRHLTQLKEELKATQLRAERLSRSSDDSHPVDAQTLENFRTQAVVLDRLVKTEKDKNDALQGQLTSLQGKHQQLLSDYHDLLVETDKKVDRHDDVAALKRDYDQRLDNLTAQLFASEDVLGNKEDLITGLQQRVKDYDVLKNQLSQQKQDIEAL